MLRASRLKVHEIYASIQGESSFAGWPCSFVRLTGCQMRCVWCDTPQAFYEGTWMSLEEILERLGQLAVRLVEVTGGEPLLQPAVHPLMSELCDRGFEVLLETGGGLDIGKVDPRVRRILDIKCPDSGEAGRNRWANLDLLKEGDELKFVIASRQDYEWARARLGERPGLASFPVHLSPVWGQLDPRDLAAWILEDRLPVRLGLQLHKYLWGPEARGV